MDYSEAFLFIWPVLVFVIGAVIGSFLNVCIARLPLEKSLAWPGSSCGNCLQPIHWYDNLPLISYLWLRGRCRRCGARFSMRYFWVELLTALGWAGLFLLEMKVNVHGWPASNPWEIAHGFYPLSWWLGFGFHAILFSFLMVAAFCDMDGRQIPLSVTLPGTAMGLIGAMLFPWPYPWTPDAALAKIHNYEKTQRTWKERNHQLNEAKEMHDLPWHEFAPPVIQKVEPEQGVYSWPVWGPLPAWLPPGSWQLGLLTGLAGMLTGTLLLRLIAFLFGMGLGKEAMGLGDADLMMMAGAFLGWQLVATAFFVSVFPALVVGIFQVVVRRDNSLPFGPSLAIGVLITMLSWRLIGPMTQFLFFYPILLLCLAGAGAGILLGAAYFLRITRPTRAREEQSAASDGGKG